MWQKRLPQHGALQRDSPRHGQHRAAASSRNGVSAVQPKSSQEKSSQLRGVCEYQVLERFDRDVWEDQAIDVWSLHPLSCNHGSVSG